MTTADVDALFDQPGVGQRAGPQRRTDGWVGGRAYTWHGHYRENPAIRAGADARRVAADKPYATRVAEALRSDDAEILAGNDALANAGLTVEPVSPGIGASIRGVDMASPTDTQVDQIWRLLMDRKVVFFRDQGHITRDDHIAFAKRFANIGWLSADSRHSPRTGTCPRIIPNYSGSIRTKPVPSPPPTGIRT